LGFYNYYLNYFVDLQHIKNRSPEPKSAAVTTVTFAQDWNVDSRTRIDMSEANSKALEGDKMSTSQRATLGYTFGGSDWGIHASTNVNYTLGTDAATISVYEAYASTDLMGYANVTVGRQALDYGSGAIVSSNQWGADRTTWDGFTFGLDLDMADVTFGYASSTDSISGEDGSNSQMWLNAAKGEGDWNANLLYVSTTIGASDAATAMGLDLSYAMMGGDLNLNVSYNTASGYGALGMEAEDMDMTMLGATYNVNEEMSISGSQTTYGENGFDVGSASMGGYNASGSLGYLTANDVNTAIGGTYAMGDFTLGATMNMITNEGDGVSTVEIEDRDVMDISVGYTMSENANLSLSMATDTQGESETNYMWITLNIMP
jgi:hypothetical protein